MGVRISVFAPQLCNTSVTSGLDEYADGCLFYKRIRLVPFLSGWGHRKGGVGDGWWVRGVQPKILGTPVRAQL